MGPNLNNANVGSIIDTDKAVYILEGNFTYSFTTSNNGGSFDIPNPEPGVLFLPVSIYSRDGGNTWFGDLDGQMFGGVNYPDMLTCSRTDVIRYRWGAFGPSGSFNVLYRTALLAVSV